MRTIKFDDSREPGGELDNWVTPAWAVQAVLPRVAWRRSGAWSLIDPGAGCGDVALAAVEGGLVVGNVLGVELHPGRARICEAEFEHRIKAPHMVTLGDWTSREFGDRIGDWLAKTKTGANTLVLGNPPYTKPRETVGLEFVEQALRVASRGVVALLLPLDFASGVERAERVHDRHRCSCYPLRRRPDFGGTMVGKRPVAWFVWDGNAGSGGSTRCEFRVL